MNEIRTGIVLILLGFTLLFAGMVLSGGSAGEVGVLVMIGSMPLAAGTWWISPVHSTLCGNHPFALKGAF